MGGYIGVMGEPFGVRDPTFLVLQAHLPPGGETDPVLTAMHEECDRIAQNGLDPGELDRTVARMAAQLLRDSDAVIGRCLRMAVLELQRGDGGLATSVASMLETVTEEQVRAAAATLVAPRRALIEVVAGAGGSA